MANLKLGSDHDLVFENGQIVFVTGKEAIAQDVLVRLQFFKGEWLLDTRLGIPYYGQVLGQKPNLGIIKNLFRDIILQAPGIDSVNNLELVFGSTTRTLIVTFFAPTIDGEITFREELII